MINNITFGTKYTKITGEAEKVAGKVKKFAGEVEKAAVEHSRPDATTGAELVGKDAANAQKAYFSPFATTGERPKEIKTETSYFSPFANTGKEAEKLSVDPKQWGEYGY